MSVTLVVPDASDLGAVSEEVADHMFAQGDPDGRAARALLTSLQQIYDDLSALDTGVAAGVGLQKRTVTIGQADLTDAVNGEAQAINVGAVLPANAVILAHEVNVATLFSGGGATAVKLDIGGSSTTAIVDQMDVFTGAATGALSPRTGAHAQGKFSAEQLVATFTPDGGSALLGLTAGSLTITVWFSVLA
jgi:hypothetical protein